MRQVSDSNRLEVGKLLTQIACANCHALEPGAPLSNVPDKFHRATDEDLIAAFLNGPLKHGSQSYMPRIDLPATEVNAIAHYLASVNRGVDVEQIIVQNRALQGAPATAQGD